MSYTPTTWTTGDTITATALNKIEQGIADAGGGGYDLVIEYDVPTSTATIASGDILDCEDKLDNGEIVNAIAVIKDQWSFLPSGKNTSKTAKYLPLVLFEPPYAMMKFEAVMYSSEAFLLDLSLNYDPATGEIDSIGFSNRELSTI